MNSSKLIKFDFFIVKACVPHSSYLQVRLSTVLGFALNKPKLHQFRCITELRA
jgi:hypothetical protein